MNNMCGHFSTLEKIYALLLMLERYYTHYEVKEWLETIINEIKDDKIGIVDIKEETNDTGASITYTLSNGTSKTITVQRGPKGDKGDQGPLGILGPKGKDGTMTFSDLTDEQINYLKGEKGDNGISAPFICHSVGTQVGIIYDVNTSKYIEKLFTDTFTFDIHSNIDVYNVTAAEVTTTFDNVLVTCSHIPGSNEITVNAVISNEFEITFNNLLKPLFVVKIYYSTEDGSNVDTFELPYTYYIIRTGQKGDKGDKGETIVVHMFINNDGLLILQQTENLYSFSIKNKNLILTH